jgi:hypothetical protein
MSPKAAAAAAKEEKNEAGQTLYAEICELVGFEKGEDEDPNDFKGRVVEEFSNMAEWPDAKYDALPARVKDWVYDATNEYKANRSRKRQRALPAMTGLDVAERTGRADLNAPVRKTKESKRQPGTDCVTRTMKLLAKTPNATADDLVTQLKELYAKDYSKAAVRYAIQAFHTAKTVLEEEKRAA